MKVRPRKRKLGGRVYRDFLVDLGKINGVRQRHFFPTEKEAAAFLAQRQALKRRHGESALALAPETALRYAAIEERLGQVSATIEQAADYYLEHHKPVREHLALGPLLDRCVLDMELRKVASNTIATFNCACRSFIVPRAAMPAGDVTREMIKTWIYGNEWQPKTQRGYLGALRTFFAWAVDEQYLAQSPLQPPAEATGKRRSVIQLPKMVKKEPAIFTVEQIERLFLTAMTAKTAGQDADGARRDLPVYRRLLGFLALATFAGIRPFELVRLEVSAIDLEARHVPLDAGVTKTNDRRIVDLSENCVAFLRIWRKEFPQYKRVAPPSWDRLMKGLRKAAKLVPWPHDVLRHCFASYFHATYQDKTRLQAQMGHSVAEDTLDNHYRAVRMPGGRPLTKAEAERFWKVYPLGAKSGCATAD